MNQYLHLLSNTGIGLPTDLWVPATRRVKPQQSQQVALGLAKDFPKQKFAVTLEGYYKWMENVLSYKEGASFLGLANNEDVENQVSWEDMVTAGSGLSYGAELLIQKKVGKFTGWIGYTLSWTWLQFDSLNFGKAYPARYDRRHDISVVTMYNINDRVELSATWVYGTGNAVTLPLSSYYVEHHGLGPNNYGYPYTVQDYGEKNSFRMAPYHRADIGIRVHKQLKRCERIFEFSVYNVYNRKNPFYYYTEYDSKTYRNKLMQISLFPILPSVSWTWKF
jgi:hypothetical protein